MTQPAIGDELRAFLESGLAITVATRNAALEPDGAVGWAARVAEDGRRMTVFLHEEAAATLLVHLATCPEIAVNLDQPTTHRACQVKGRFVSSRAARPDERAEVERQVEGFATLLEAIGIQRAATAGWKTWPCTALEFEVGQLFGQTPGPGAGEPLR